MKNIRNFVDGKLSQAQSSNYNSLFKPTTGEEYAHVPITTNNEFQKIIEKMKVAGQLAA